ncbi:MAG TPA: phospholipase D-like domain-containing protein [Planctomycetota bacterium]
MALERRWKVIWIAAGVLGAAFVVLLLVNLSSGQVAVERKVEHLYSVAEPEFVRSMGTLLGPALLEGNRIETLLNGEEIFPAMLAAIRAARRTITFETYIYWSGEIGREFAAALSERARAGVRVHVLLDWLGAAKMEAELLDEMEAAGVEVEKYRPLHWYNLSRMNHRTHRKLLVVDGAVGFTGGVGIADSWQGQAEDPEHWRDTHFRLQGPAVAQMQAAFLDNWLELRSEVLHGDDYFPPLASAGEASAQVFKSSFGEGSESTRLMYLMSIACAAESILLSSSYFVPDAVAIEAFVAAKQRGVRVELIVPGEHMDSKVVRRASRGLWGKLLEAGVEIHEYQPTMFHVKVLVVDGLWSSVGSTNFDSRSFSLNDEANLNVLDAAFAAEQARIFAEDKRHARRITLEAWQSRPRSEKFQEWLSGLLRSQL